MTGLRFEIMHKSGKKVYKKADDKACADEIEARLTWLQQSKRIARFWRLDSRTRIPGNPPFERVTPDMIYKKP